MRFNEKFKEMNRHKIKFGLSIGLVAGLLVAAGFVFIAYARTWGKTDIEFKIHINEKLVLQSVYGESPTFAIWIENPETEASKTIFVTKRAGVDDWEGKVDVPTALPLWDKVSRQEKQSDEKAMDIDAITGATPVPGYFTTRVQVKPGSEWICWIEMNLSGDYNEHYPEFDDVSKTTDEYGTGQPALVYKARIEAVEGNRVTPDVVGMSVLNENGAIIRPVEGMTTALDVFDEIMISIVKPKPRVL
jgi:hypothetical protein